MLNKVKAAIDIGNHSTKIIEYKPTKNGIKITDIYRTEGLQGDIKSIIKPLKAKELTLMLSSSESNLVELEKPNKNLRALKKDGFNADYIKIKDNIYLFSYIKAETIEKFAKPLIKAKKDVKALDTQSSAMLYFSKLFEDDYETKIFFDIGHLSSKILIIHKGEVIKYEKLNLGIYQIVEDLKESIGTSHSKAMELVIRTGLNRNDLPFNINEILEDVNITEFEYGSSIGDQMEHFLVRMSDLLRTGKPFKADSSKIILMGGGPLISGVEDVIRENLNVKVESFSLVSSTQGKIKVINETDKKIDSGYATAIGLALREVVR